MSETVYSKTIPGARVNYGWPVRFDRTGGCVGISQEQGAHVNRILLSVKQVQAFLDFVGIKNGSR